MEQQLTLKEIQFKLGVPQHVLIHLCEKNVIVPEYGDTAGRGQWRRFSRRNLFEFAVALELRKYEIPVALVGAIICVLGSFEKAARKKIKGFSLPDSLIGAGPKLVMKVVDGSALTFSIGNKVSIGFDMAKIIEGEAKTAKVARAVRVGVSYLSFDLTGIAKRL